MPDIRLPALDSTIEPCGRKTRKVVLLYSPRQVASAVFIGGPVAFIYFLKSNFAAMGSNHGERMAVIGGSILFVALAASILILPRTHGFSMIPVGFAAYVAQKHQMSKQAIAISTNYDFHSNWKVVVRGVLCLIASVVIMGATFFALAYFGVVGM